MLHKNTFLLSFKIITLFVQYQNLHMLQLPKPIVYKMMSSLAYNLC